MNNSTNVVAGADLSAPANVPLADCSQAIEQYLQQNAPYQAVALAQMILKRLPRHLPTYQRLLRAAWLLKRWDEGEDWGRRMLRADPCHALAWRALAMAAETRGKRAQAHAIWQRAFEAEPYEAEIRAGLIRTGLDLAGALTLNLACLARLALRGYRWERAATLYQRLCMVDSRRVDFQVGLMVAFWQQRRPEDAYRLARMLAQSHPHLVLAWVVMDALGDADDKALARNPIATMDPDGEFVQMWLGVSSMRTPVILSVGTSEAKLLEAGAG